MGGFLVGDNVEAYGECTKYGTMAYYDSLSGGCKCMSGYVFGKGILGDDYCISKDQWCRDKYGYNAMRDYLSNGCKCMSGHVFGKDFLGNTSCVSADQLCRDQYGVMSRYNSLYENCECSFGYVFGENIIGKKQCISEDQWCEDRYGFNSRYNTLKDECECRYGYEFTLKIGGGLECVSCSSKYGYHSSYNSLSDKCECDDGYTLDDDNQCVKKQNNVYFLLKEIDTDNNEIIIKSDYDYRYYLVKYGYGCRDFSVKKYLNKKIVINLGTDFNVDRWDKIVLPDHDEVCEISRVEKINSSFSFIPTCPGNSYLATDNKCYCDEGYKISSDGNNCYRIICTDNSSLVGNSCICDNGYIWDSSRSNCERKKVERNTSFNAEEKEDIKKEEVSNSFIKETKNDNVFSINNEGKSIIEDETELNKNTEEKAEKNIESKNPVASFFKNLFSGIKSFFGRIFKK